jgi:hypothetical protein
MPVEIPSNWTYHYSIDYSSEHTLSSLEFPMFKTTWWKKRILHEMLKLFSERKVEKPHLRLAIYRSRMFGANGLDEKISKNLRVSNTIYSHVDRYLTRFYSSEPKILQLLNSCDPVELRIVWINKLLNYKG